MSNVQKRKRTKNKEKRTKNKEQKKESKNKEQKKTKNKKNNKKQRTKNVHTYNVSGATRRDQAMFKNNVKTAVFEQNPGKPCKKRTK